MPLAQSGRCPASLIAWSCCSPAGPPNLRQNTSLRVSIFSSNSSLSSTMLVQSNPPMLTLRM